MVLLSERFQMKCSYVCRQRGIEKVEDEKMIVRGKLNDVSRKIPDDGLSALVRSKIEEGFKNL